VDVNKEALLSGGVIFKDGNVMAAGQLEGGKGWCDGKRKKRGLRERYSFKRKASVKQKKGLSCKGEVQRNTMLNHLSIIRGGGEVKKKIIN